MQIAKRATLSPAGAKARMAHIRHIELDPGRNANKKGKGTRMKKKFKALATVACAGVLALSLAGCGSSGSSSSSSSTTAATTEDTTITVAACPAPHADILRNAVAPVLEEMGYTLDVMEFSDYIQPNTAVDEGEADANYFQHVPYLENFNEENGTNLVSVASVHVEPFGLYSDKITDLSELQEGATVAVPNDTTNEARALLLLEAEGLIELDPDAGVLATPLDITSNPLNLQFEELAAANLPSALPDVDVAAVNYNYAYEADIFDLQIAVESSDSLAAQTYANVLVVNEDNVDSDKTKALVEAINSDAVREYIEENYPFLVITF
jgi:D-methionine transport system substrate-binding protein